MYDIPMLKLQEAAHSRSVRQHFLDFFEKHDYANDTQAVISKKVSNLAELQATYAGTGFYLIQTDYLFDENPCTHAIGGLKTIYRGHCYTVKKRLISHLMNSSYRSTLPSTGVRYDVCMKLHEKNGIDMIEEPYVNYHWRIIVHKMPNSSKLMREQAELAFDLKFGRPLGSREGRLSRQAGPLASSR